MHMLTYESSILSWLDRPSDAYPVVIVDQFGSHKEYFVRSVGQNGSVTVQKVVTLHPTGGGNASGPVTYTREEWTTLTKGGVMVRPGETFQTPSGVRVEILSVSFCEGTLELLAQKDGRRWTSRAITAHDLVANAKRVRKSNIPLQVTPPGFEDGHLSCSKRQ